jgi:hypothetical protein
VRPQGREVGGKRDAGDEQIGKIRTCKGPMIYIMKRLNDLVRFA